VMCQQLTDSDNSVGQMKVFYFDSFKFQPSGRPNQRVLFMCRGWYRQSKDGVSLKMNLWSNTI